MAGPIAPGTYAYRSLTERFRLDESHARLPQEHRYIAGSPLRLLQVDRITPALAGRATPDAGLALRLKGRDRGRFNLGDGWRDGHRRPGDILMHPHGTDIDSVVDGPCRVLRVAFPFREAMRLVEEVDGRMPPDGFGSLYGGPFRNAFVEQLCLRLWIGAADNTPFGRLFADGALASLVAALLQQAEAGPARPNPAPPPVAALPEWRLRRLKAEVDERLAEDLALSDLAAMAGLSRFHFARAFKAATQSSPYRWLLERRISRARSLLAEGALPLAEVALTCGFSGQSQFTTTFHRLTGVTPGAFRRATRE